MTGSMKRRGSYHGGSTVVVPGSDWYSREADPESEDYKPTFQEILQDFVSEEIISNLASQTDVNQQTDSSRAKMHSPDDAKDPTDLIGYNSNKHDPKPYVPGEAGKKFASKRPNSPFKRPKRQPVIEYKSKSE